MVKFELADDFKVGLVGRTSISEVEAVEHLDALPVDLNAVAWTILQSLSALRKSSLVWKLT